MPKNTPVSLRLPADLLEEIRREARRTARRPSSIVHSALAEGIRMRRCPGIVFTAGPAGRRATVAGTGIDVWEVVRLFKSVGGTLKRLERAMPQLSQPQLEAALHYYRCYPSEIDERLTSEELGYRELPSEPFVRRFKI